MPHIFPLIARHINYTVIKCLKSSLLSKVVIIFVAVSMSQNEIKNLFTFEIVAIDGCSVCVLCRLNVIFPVLS